MEMARLARKLIRSLTSTLQVPGGLAATLAIVAGVVAVAGAGAVAGCGKPLCPGGMRLDTARSKDGVNAFCESTTDKSHALFIQLHPGGARRQMCPFVGGRPAGLYQAFHSNGARWLEGRYADGRKVGHWAQWAPDGRKVAEGEYRDGQTVEGAPVGFPATCEAIAW